MAAASASLVGWATIENVSESPRVSTSSEFFAITSLSCQSIG
jgi:hypothetical protein